MEEKLMYRGMEIVREINYGNSMCGSCVADRTDGHCGLAITGGGSGDKYYCSDSENEYIFKYVNEEKL